MVRSHRVAVTLSVTFLIGCASDRQAPFHVYQSPLLAAEQQNPRPVERTFDPSAPGDWTTESETVVAKSEDSVTRARKKAERREQAKVRKKPKSNKLPSLSITTAVGGKDDDAGSSSAEATDYAPPLAAAYVHKTFSVNGVNLPAASQTSVPRLWEACKKSGKTHQGTPLPGDAAFFHNAFDANNDGRNNDWYTHVAVVEQVSADGTATALAWRGGSVVKLTVNPGKPDDVEQNSQLRVPTADDPPFTQYHAGQLFAGWCTVLDGKRDVIVMDSWSPDVQ